MVPTSLKMIFLYYTWYILVMYMLTIWTSTKYVESTYIKQSFLMPNVLDRTSSTKNLMN